MPLLAIDTDHSGALIDLTAVPDTVWESIWRMKTGDRLRCRSCDGAVIAKRMEASGLRFIAHRNVTPDCPTQGESARHLHLKAKFATAFRNAGWTADLEVIGDGWRADVLATSPDVRRLAVEVQLSSISYRDATERAARHAASGVETLWIVERRTDWTRDMRSIVIGPGDRVADSVVIPGASGDCVLSPPASIARFVECLAQGRLTPIVDPDGLFARFFYAGSARTLLQLDGCVDAWLPILAGKKRRQDAIDRAMQRRSDAAAAARRVRDEAMVASLHACRAWFERRSDLKMWFGAHHMREPEDAVAKYWDRDFGLVVCVGTAKCLWVLAVAEPRRLSARHSPLVAAWTDGQKPSAILERYPLIYTPTTEITTDTLTLKRAGKRALRRYGSHLQSDDVRLRAL